MGNNKNKRHHYNNHCHASMYKKSRNKKTKKIPANKSACTIHGSRIINISLLGEYINVITKHAAECGGEITLVGEKRDGLASILNTKCSRCDHCIPFATSTKVKGPKGVKRWEINLTAVWGQMTTGGGHTSLSNTMGVLGVPVMAKGSFTPTQNDIGEWWRQKLEETMIEAGKEEKRLAEENGDYHQGVPSVTVIVDAGWSKRAHKHSYNAKSGVGIIIGQRTGKLLHLGVRNKYCASCATGIPVSKHKCYKNWKESSSEMEADIILEGFLAAEKTHGVRYTQFVGDGDSAVYPTLLTKVPIWGRDIKKLECCNHACKCHRSSLEKLVSENPNYRGKGGLTLKMRKRLTSAARCAIKMRSGEKDRAKAITQLGKDLINGPLHCFGHHEKCSADFCRHAREKENHQAGDNSTPDDDVEDASPPETLSSKFPIRVKHGICNHDSQYSDSGNVLGVAYPYNVG